MAGELAEVFNVVVYRRMGHHCSALDVPANADARMQAFRQAVLRNISYDFLWQCRQLLAPIAQDTQEVASVERRFTTRFRAITRSELRFPSFLLHCPFCR